MSFFTYRGLGKGNPLRNVVQVVVQTLEKGFYVIKEQVITKPRLMPNESEKYENLKDII